MEEVNKKWWVKDMDASEISFTNRTFKQKLRVIRFYIIIGIVGGWLTLLLGKISERKNLRNEIKEKFRCFKPTLHDNSWNKRISWEIRDKPLTDEEMSQFWDETKYFS
jgi:hypothetical protein